MSYTKGPWKKADRLNGPWWHISSEYTVGGKGCIGGRQAIAAVHGESKKGSVAYAEMFEANARLISAAPELLEALQYMADVVEFSGCASPEALRKAHAAISRALGENKE